MDESIDVGGMYRYKLIRGALDLGAVAGRVKGRSKYGGKYAGAA